MLDLFEASVYVLRTGITNLLPLALTFFLLALLVKGREVVHAMRNSFSSSVFNIALMSLNLVLVTPIIVLISNSLTASNFTLVSPTVWTKLPDILVIFVAIFAGDFIGYWRHRLEHTRFLWPSHSLHHSDEQMTWLTLQRFHPFNRLSTYLIDSSFLLLLGFPPYAAIANNMLRHYYGYFIHADLPWTYGKFALVFVSPAMHRWHHATERSAHNTNFATVFSIFDWMFGTYRVPGVCNVDLGVSYIGKSNLLTQLLYPFRPGSYKKFGGTKSTGPDLSAD